MFDDSDWTNDGTLATRSAIADRVVSLPTFEAEILNSVHQSCPRVLERIDFIFFYV